jgi:hypothetical protein
LNPDFVPDGKAGFQAMIFHPELVALSGYPITRPTNEGEPTPAVGVDRGAVPLAKQIVGMENDPRVC